MTPTFTILDSNLLERRLEGRNLSGVTLGENLGTVSTLLVFLRHFG